MKVTTKQPTFKPFSITIEIESETEATGLYCIFSESSITDAANLHHQSGIIRDAIDKHAKLSDSESGLACFEEFLNKLKANDGATHEKLDDLGRGGIMLCKAGKFSAIKYYKCDECGHDWQVHSNSSRFSPSICAACGNLVGFLAGISDAK